MRGYYYRSPTKLRKGGVFSRVYLTFCSWGGPRSLLLMIHWNSPNRDPLPLYTGTNPQICEYDMIWYDVTRSGRCAYMLGLSVKLCFMVEGTLFFRFSFHPTSFSIIFFICFLSSSSSAFSSSNLSFYSLPFLFIFFYFLLFLMFTLFLFFVILHCSFLLILFLLNLPLNYPLLW